MQPEPNRSEDLNAPVTLVAGASGCIGGQLTDRLPVMLCPAGWARRPNPSPLTTMIREYARQKGLRRWLISVPVVTRTCPDCGWRWTPAALEVGRHLTEGLQNPTVVRHRTALDVFLIKPIGVRAAIQKALGDTAG